MAQNAITTRTQTKSATGKDAWRLAAMPTLIIGAMWLWFCGPMMLGQTVVGFRDSGYLYYPMFEAIDAVWASGKIPLWNPYCNFGLPVVADGTSSVFYPGKLVFLARFLAYPSRYGIYLSMHVLLAAIGTYWMARFFKCNRAGATLAAVSYAFGGPVIFQVTNVIYLVSAAWLPIALVCVWQLLATRRLGWAVAGGGVCAMMILGGDPQMVYHVGLIAIASIFWQMAASFDVKVGIKQLACLAGMVVVTSMMAAVQLIPSADLTARSERSAGDRVVNLYSCMTNGGQEENGLSQLLKNEDAIVGQFQFSLAPWSLAEMLAPNISGRPFPRHSRWVDSLPAADRMWYPSLYIGLVVVLLAATKFRLWGRDYRSVWFSRILVVFLLGAFGWYGLVWAWREIFGAAVVGGEVWAAPVGGVYWWMSVCLPKYFVFRYPAKLFVVANLAMCLLAGRSLNDMGRRNLGVAFKRMSLVLAALFALALMASLVWGQDWVASLKIQELDGATLYGPFQSELAVRQIVLSLLHAVVVMVCLSGLLVGQGRCLLIHDRLPKNRFVWGLVLLTAVDVAVANRWLLSEVPATVFTRPLSDEESLDILADTGRPATLVYLSGQFPQQFRLESSPDRLQELMRWQLVSLQPKCHWGRKVRLIGSFHSIWPQRYQQFVFGYVDEAQALLRSEGWDSDLDVDFETYPGFRSASSCS
jgi:hypothetical protein